MVELEKQKKYEQMKARIDKMNLDYDRIKNEYTSGIGIDHIAMMNKITIEQLEWVLKNILKITKGEWQTRKENRKKFAEIQIPFELPDNRRTNNI